MTHINLLPWRQRRRQRQRRAFFGALAVAVCAAALVVALAAWRKAETVERHRRASDLLTADLATVNARIAAIDALRRDREALEQHSATLRRLMAERGTAVAILNALSLAAVPGARYTRLARDDRTVTVRGVADSHDRIADLMRNLGTAAPFEGSVLKTISGTDGEAPTHATGTVAFELSLLVAPPSA